MTDREQFLATLFTGPILTADAIVVLCGEDAKVRADVAAQLYRTGGAPTIVLSGGRHEPPAMQGAEATAGIMMALGITPSALLIESGSQNTREQAVNVLKLAADNEWRRLLLVASAYHLPRAFLTFVAALPDEGAVHVVPVAASHAPWWQCPPGLDRTRAELLLVEGVKTAEYQALGHCASDADGLDYLQHWEGR